MTSTEAIKGNSGANVDAPLTDERFLYSTEGGIATITINRPGKLNALLPDMILEFSDLLERARRDNAVRCVVLRGEGRAFCAGDDLNPEDRFKYGPPDMHTRLKMGYPRLVNDILQMRKPVIAMLRGYAVGAGFDIALACDFRIAAPDLKMAAIFVKRGLGGGCSYLLPRYVGFGKATELLLLGEMIDAPQADRLGLLTKIVPDDQLEAETYALAGRLAKAATQAIGAIKNARNQGLGCDPVKGLEWQILCNVDLMFHLDAREGPRAYVERREPNFTGEWIDLQYDAFDPNYK
ncbi:enoyl-CoA hydratase/isomerase family protein [Ancylobacter mangrovi]|uniref:enoyl-CoA hydratase/isomerase family protein n=1 Tax=Ancylobacter mangrovi TaxID=2972472 RepID=UPI0021635318|nr:enoyl-CoA hydratase-related protein [Ancylobacter mangrovi]MCS0505168.1 enoyl-CoA hydratase-related protein [Ancylobacter mangrovi]